MDRHGDPDRHMTDEPSETLLERIVRERKASAPLCRRCGLSLYSTSKREHLELGDCDRELQARVIHIHIDDAVQELHDLPPM